MLTIVVFERGFATTKLLGRRLPGRHCRVLWLSAGGGLLESLGQLQPSLLILDSRAFESDPVQFMQQLRKHPDAASLPVMLLGDGARAMLEPFDVCCLPGKAPSEALLGEVQRRLASQQQVVRGEA